METILLLYEQDYDVVSFFGYITEDKLDKFIDDFIEKRCQNNASMMSKVLSIDKQDTRIIISVEITSYSLRTSNPKIYNHKFIIEILKIEDSQINQYHI